MSSRHLKLAALAVLTLLAASACGREPAPTATSAQALKTATPVEYELFYDEVGTRAEQPGHWVITTAEDYRRFFGHPAPSFVDFGKEWVVFYAGGLQAPGSEARINDMTFDVHTLTVFTTLVTPDKSCPQEGGPYAVFALARVRKPAGAVLWRTTVAHEAYSYTCEPVLPPEGEFVPTLSLSWDFRKGAQDWQAGFSDYADGADYQLESRMAPLPDGTGTGFYVQGMNRSDDLFMYLKRRVGAAEGLEPGRTYRVRVDVTLASNAPSGCFGVGGAPGESVFLKGGAFAAEPVTVTDSLGGYVLSVDKGAQSSGSPGAVVLGNVANGLECEQALAMDPPPYVTLQRNASQSAQATADESGNLWLLVGTDSGYEGFTALYYDRITVHFAPADVN